MASKRSRRLGVRDCRAQGRGQIDGTLHDGEPAAFGDRRRRGLRKSGGPEVHRELQLASLACWRPPLVAAGAAWRLAGYADRRHGPGCGAQGIGRVDGQFPGQRGQPVDQAAELELTEETDHLGPVVVGEPGCLQVQRDRQVPDDPGQLAALEYLLAGFDELFTQLVRLDLVEPPEDPFERTELPDKLGGGLLPHPGYARDVVRWVALEGLVVDHLVRSKLEPLPDLGGIVVDSRVHTLAGRHQAGVLGDDLEHVEIAGHDRGVNATGIHVSCDRADHVVRLEARQLVDGDSKRGDHLSNLRELRPKVVRHGRAGGLVGGELLVPEGRAWKIEAGGHAVRPDVLDPPEQDAAEAKDGVHQLAPAGGQRRQGVITAVDEAVAVEQHQASHAGLERTGAGSWRVHGRRPDGADRLPIGPSVTATLPR